MSAALRHGAALAVLFALPMLIAGCGALLSKGPDRPLYRLNPVVEFRQAPPRVGAQLVIATPTATAGLDTKRMALIRSAVAIDYFADAEWVDRPPFLVKEALVQAFQNSRAFAGVSSEGLGINADYVLNTELRDFTAIYDSPQGPPLVRVRIAGELITMPGRNIAAATSVTREVRAGANDLAAIVQAFDRAVGGAVEELVTWTATNLALSARRK
jgi:cholesterol transport system auxiliary component